ncbi:MAG: transposase [Desulfatiglandaceae bacterium]
MTKRRVEQRAADRMSIERGVREFLARKVSGTLLGTWLLLPEHLRLGTWDLLTAWTGADTGGLEPRLALQIVHEAALCLTGVRQSRALCHQGFDVANGLPFIATDQEIHALLDGHTVQEAQQLQVRLGLLRRTRGHYHGTLLAFDPHRIPTASRRVMPRKKGRPHRRAEPVLQTFFSVDADTGQPLGFTIGSAGKTTTRASLELLKMVEEILPVGKMLLLADTEYESRQLIEHIAQSDRYDILMPAARRKKVLKIITALPYETHWPGYATAESPYQYQDSPHAFRLIGQRTGERQYSYKPFIATGEAPRLALITEQYPARWTIEEFFNFEGAMGWNRAATFNLNIRYGQLSLALIAQAVAAQLKRKLPEPYKTWNATHLADALFRGIDGDLRVQKDTILVTMYNVPEHLNLAHHYTHLPQRLEKEGVNPKIPWLFDLKVDFRFK